MFLNTNSVNLCQNSIFAKLSGCQKWCFRKEKSHFIILSILCFCKKNKKRKQLNGRRPQKPIKLMFLRCSSKTEKNEKNGCFNKTCLTLFVSGREKKNAHFRAHYLFWSKNLFWDHNSENQEKLITNCGFSGNCPKPKMTPFFGKRCFLTWVKKWAFTNCVFEKLCSSENTIFIFFSAKHNSCNKKAVCWKKNTENVWKIVVLVFEHGNKVFLFVSC